MTLVATTAACITLAATSANAATTIPLTNSTFETTTGGGSFPLATGWTSVNTATHAAFPRGNNSGLGTRFGYTTGIGYQTLSGPGNQYEADKTYTFQGLIVDNDTAALNGPNITFELGYFVGATYNTLQSAVYDADGLTDWTLSNGVSFNTGLASPAIGKDIVVVLRGSTGGVWFDNVTLTSVPEPSAALLGGLGMLVLLRRRRA